MTASGEGLRDGIAAPAGKDDVDNVSRWIAIDALDVRAASDQPLGEGKAEGEILVRPWRPHNHGKRCAVETDFERFLDGHMIDDRARPVADDVYPTYRDAGDLFRHGSCAV